LDLAGYLIHFLHAVHGLQLAPAPVILRKGCRLLVIDLETLCERLGIVVCTGAAHGFRRAPFNPVEQNAVIDNEFDHSIKLRALPFQHLVQGFGLRDVPGKAVKNIALRSIRLRDALCDDADHNIVRHEFTTSHDGFGFLADLRARSHCRSQHVASRELDEAILLFQPLRLRSLAGTGRPEKDEFHRRAPLSLDFLMRPSYWCASRWLWIWETVSMVTLTTMSREVPPK